MSSDPKYTSLKNNDQYSKPQLTITDKERSCHLFCSECFFGFRSPGNRLIYNSFRLYPLRGDKEGVDSVIKKQFLRRRWFMQPLKIISRNETDSIE